MAHPLDNPVWDSLNGAQAHFALRHGAAARFDPDVTVFAALADDAGPSAWDDLAALAAPGAQLVVVDAPFDPPADWEIVMRLAGVQLTGEDLLVQDDPEAVELGPDDEPEMAALVQRTKPGPWRPRTIEMGRYVGVRVDGELVAMAGERLRPSGWVEISAVCTDERFRGRGLGSRLVRAVGAGIVERGESPMLHASAGNVNAIRLYQSMGFVFRRDREFLRVRTPR
ncbi:MAG TPA: GNAT family N-acetyltransferase [Acidothermaceae bacterium]